MLKKFKIVISIILSLMLMVNYLPMRILAIEDTSLKVIVEEESLREENVKHYKMPDGSYTAIVYSNPVHRKDNNGVWQDIDNRMNETVVKNKQGYATADGRAVFAKNINSEDPTIFELTENGYSIKVSFADVDLKNTTAKLSNHATRYVPNGKDDVETQYKKLKTIDNNTTISYKNLLKGMTLEYVLSANDVKENIIIEKMQNEYVYSFTYELVGLIALLNEDGSINLWDENTRELVCMIPAPYMYDAEGEMSYDVSYTLEDLGGGLYTLNVCANKEWINNTQRAFPVVIDPTMTFEASYWDTYINSSNPDANYGSSDELWISPTRTTFIDYDELPELPKNAKINRATLNMFYYYHITTGSLDVGLYLVGMKWIETALTWNTANQNLGMGIIPEQLGTVTLAASASITEASPGLASMNVTEIVQAWYAGMDNFGIALKYEGGSNSSVILKSWDAGEDTVAYYEITYSNISLPVNNGTYRVENKEYINKYVQINNQNTVVDGAIMELWDNDGCDDQKWVFEYLYNGYYKITSAETGKVLTAPDSANNSLTQTDYSLAEEQMWKVTIADTNLFKLSPKSNPSYYMSAGAGAFTSDGRNVRMRAAQSDYKDEWYIESTGSKGIFILPGMLGSSLAKTNGTNVWFDPLNYGAMALEEDGTSVNSIVSVNKDNYGVYDVYDTLYDSLKNAYGNDFDVVFFDYDFRLSIDTAAEKLSRETAFYDEVVLVAHSMGGLVACKYLADSVDNRNKTAMLITLGTPFAGSAQCINVMETGELLKYNGNYVFKTAIKNMSKNCYSAYQLMPTKAYYNKTGIYPLTVNGTNYSSVYSQLKNTSWGKKSDGTTKPMFNAASSFHSSLTIGGTFVIDRSDVTVYTIAGTDVSTISSVALDANYNITGLSTSTLGDGIVMEYSAGYGQPDFSFSGVDHMELVSNTSVISKVKSLISTTTGISANSTTKDLEILQEDNAFAGAVSSSRNVNSQGVLVGCENKCVNVFTNIDAILYIGTEETVLIGDHVYDLHGNEVGSTFLVGNSGHKIYVLYDGTYSLRNTTYAKIEYMTDGYCDNVDEYNFVEGGNLTIKISSYE